MTLGLLVLIGSLIAVLISGVLGPTNRPEHPIAPLTQPRIASPPESAPAHAAIPAITAPADPAVPAPTVTEPRPVFFASPELPATSFWLLRPGKSPAAPMARTDDPPVEHFTPAPERKQAAAQPTSPQAVPEPALPPPVAPAPPSPQSVAETMAMDPPAPAAPAARPDPQISLFLIDASGTTIDLQPSMVDWALNRAGQLPEHHRFTVLFFRDGQVETPLGPALRPAGAQAVRELQRHIRLEHGLLLSAATGRSDPTAALEHCRHYRPGHLYLLSGNRFGRIAHRDQEGAALRNRIDLLLRELGVQVHAVQFADIDPEAVLQRFALAHGGTFTFVPTVESPSPMSPAPSRPRRRP